MNNTTTMGDVDVSVLGASVRGAGSFDDAIAERIVHDEEIDVRVMFCVEGPRGEDDAPWGPMAEAIVPMTSLRGPVGYARAGGLMTVLR